MGMVKVMLRRDHPGSSMRARLSDGSVIEVPKTGLWFSGDLVSQEMRDCGWFEVEGVEEIAERIADEVVKDVLASETRTGTDEHGRARTKAAVGGRPRPKTDLRVGRIAGGRKGRG
jgi:hypothetical protein